jgi:predicted nucleotidyltransferase
MIALIETRREQIAELCRRYRVERLEVFGSAAKLTT